MTARVATIAALATLALSATACSSAAHDPPSTAEPGTASTHAAADPGAAFVAPQGIDQRPDGIVLRRLYDADLTASQKLALVNAQQAQNEDRVQLADALRADRRQMRDALGDSSPDATHLHALLDAELATYGKLAHASADRALAVTATLTSDQRLALTARGTSTDVEPSREAWHGLGGPEASLVHLLHERELDEGLQATVTAVHERLSGRRHTLATTLAADRINLVAALTASPPDAALVHAHVAAALTAYDQLAHATLDDILEVQKSFAPADRARVFH